MWAYLLAFVAGISIGFVILKRSVTSGASFLDKPDFVTPFIVFSLYLFGFYFLASAPIFLFFFPVFYTIAFIGSFFGPIFANILFKIHWFVLGLTHLVLSSDKNWKKKNPDPQILLDTLKKNDDVQRKKFVFIRHAESEWNEVFNRGFGPSFFVRLVKAIIKEVGMFGTRDSTFLDSPISDTGLSQIHQLQTAFSHPFDPSKDHKIKKIITGEDNYESSIVVASNLRRAIATATLALSTRLRKSGEPVFIVSDLQEISRNVDALSLAEMKGIPEVSVLKQHLGWDDWEPVKFYNPSHNAGNKLLSSNGKKRMNGFCEWSFQQEEEVIIVGGGHSLYFREFFRSYLPYADTDFPGKSRKLVNCGVCTFEMVKGKGKDNKSVFAIVPDSFAMIHGGWTKK